MGYVSTPTARKYINAENLFENEIQWVDIINLQPEGAQTGLDASATGTKYTGTFYVYVDAQMTRHVKSVRLEVAVNNLTSGAGVKAHLYNATDASIVASTNEITSNDTRATLTISTSTFQALLGKEITIQWECTTAATGGTFDAVGARLVLIKGVS